MQKRQIKDKRKAKQHSYLLRILQPSCFDKDVQQIQRTHGAPSKAFIDIEYNKPKMCAKACVLHTIKRLERRLDTLVYKAGFASSIMCAKQMINHQQVKLNNTRVRLPSILLRPGDLVYVDHSTLSRTSTHDVNTHVLNTHVLEVDHDTHTAVYLFHPYQAEYRCADID